VSDLEAQRLITWPASRRRQRTLAATPTPAIPVATLPERRAEMLALLSIYQRMHGADLRRVLPDRAAAALDSVDLLLPFMVGFFTTARLPPQIGRRANPALEGPSAQLAFVLGLMWGNGQGVAAAVADNVVGLYDLARLLYRYASPMGHVHTAIEDVLAMVADPRKHAQRRREQWLRFAATIDAVKDFARAFESDSRFLAASAFEMGFALGEDATRWSTGSLAGKPFDRGEHLGRVFGRIVTEIVLAVIAPEEMLASTFRAGTRAIRASRIAQRLRPVLERLPGFRRLVALERELAASRAVARAEDVAPALPPAYAAGDTPANVRQIGSARRRPRQELQQQSQSVSQLTDARIARRRVEQLQIDEQRLASGDRTPVVASRSVDDSEPHLRVVRSDDPVRGSRATDGARENTRASRGVGPAALTRARAERQELLRATRAADRQGAVWPDGSLRVHDVVEIYVGKLLLRRRVRKLADLEEIMSGHIGSSSYGKDFWGFRHVPSGQRAPVAVEVKWKPGDMDVRTRDLQRAGDLQCSAEADAANWLQWLARNRRRAQSLVDRKLLDPRWMDHVWVGQNGAREFRRARQRFIVVVSPSGLAGVLRKTLDALRLSARRVIRLHEPADLRREAERIERGLAD
jgi:hypothetical protein